MSNSFATLWIIARQAPLSMRFPRQENWSGLPFSSPGDLPNPGIEPGSPALAGGFFTTKTTGKSVASLIHSNPTWSYLITLDGLKLFPVTQSVLLLAWLFHCFASMGWDLEPLTSLKLQEFCFNSMLLKLLSSVQNRTG